MELLISKWTEFQIQILALLNYVNGCLKLKHGQMKSFILFLFLALITNIGNGQNPIDTTFNPFDETLKYVPPDNTGFEFGVSFINVGMSTFMGNMNDHITPGISLNPSISLYYKRVNLFLDLFSTNLGKTKTDLNEIEVKNGYDYEAWSSMIGIGYNILGGGSLNFTPYLGPSWASLRIYNGNDSVCKAFNSSGLIYGFKLILKAEPRAQKPLFFKLLRYEGFQQLYFNLA